MNFDKLLASKPRDLRFELSQKALKAWDSGLVAAAGDDENTISVLDYIGHDSWYGEGVTAKRINAALRSIGGADVTVNINSPGGDLFEGLAIYSLLKEYPGRVTVNVLALAASAASIIAMAGDEIRISKAGFIMIHNTQTCVCGDRNHLASIVDWLVPFDDAMAGIYEDRTAEDRDDIKGMMDAETWLSADSAVKSGFADGYLKSEKVVTGRDNASASAVRRIDAALARAGLTRSERRALINEFKSGMHDAAGGGTPGATERGTPRRCRKPGVWLSG